MAKGTFADGNLGTSDGEIIWDDHKGLYKGKREAGGTE